MIVDLIMMWFDQWIYEVLEMMVIYKILGVFVIDGEGQFVGIFINCDLCFEMDIDKQIFELMMKENFVMVVVGMMFEEVKVEFYKYCIEKLFVIDEMGGFCGFIMVKDIQKMEQYLNVCKDEFGCFCVVVVIGVLGDFLDCVGVLFDVKVDVFVMDLLYVYSDGVFDVVVVVCEVFLDVCLIVGNVVMVEGICVFID